MMMRDQGKAHFVCVFLDLPWPNKESNTNFRKRLMLPEKKEYYSEIFWKTVDRGRIFWNTELQIWKTVPFSIWNVFQTKELIKESKSADCKNYGTFRLLHFIFSVSYSHQKVRSTLPSAFGFKFRIAPKLKDIERDFSPCSEKSQIWISI